MGKRKGMREGNKIEKKVWRKGVGRERASKMKS